MNIKIIALIILLVLVWTSFFVFTGLYSSGFGLPANHRMIILEKNLETGSLLDIGIKHVFVRLKSRFNPMFYVIEVLKTKVFGFNYFFWILFMNILIISTSFFIAKFLLYLNFSIFESTFFIFLLFIGKQTTILWKVASMESLGMFFFSLVIFMIIKVIKSNRFLVLKKTFLVVMVLIMSLIKESFILIIPAIDE